MGQDTTPSGHGTREPRRVLRRAGIPGHPLRLVAIAAILGALVLGSAAAGSRLIGDRAHQPATPAQAPSTVAEPATASPGSEPPLALLDLGQHGSLSDVVAWAGGLVAVGRAGDDPPSSQVWTSSDGRSWTQVPHQPAFERGVMVDVVEGGPGLIAVGWPCAIRGGTCAGAAIWLSGDGSAWEAVDSPGVADILSLGTVVAVDGTYVASGTLVGGLPIIIVSPDGRSWSVVAQGAAPTAAWKGAGDPPLAVIDGTLVAVMANPSGAVIAQSTDAVAWEPSAGPADAAFIHHVVGWQGRIALVGFDAQHRGGVWRSDGTGGWRRVADLAGPEMAMVAEVDDTLYVSARNRGAPWVTASRDGETWTTTTLPAGTHGGALYGELVPFDGRLIGAGSVYAGKTTDFATAAIWSLDPGALLPE